MSDETKNKDNSLSYVFGVIAVLVAVISWAHLLDARREAREAEIRSVEHSSRAYDEENAEYLGVLVNEIADCQRQEKEAYMKNRCEIRQEELYKQRARLDKHRIELNYQIEKLWPTNEKDPKP